MNNELIVVPKTELLEMLEGFSRRIVTNVANAIPKGENKKSEPGLERLYAKDIQRILGIKQSTFESIEDTLPLHRTRTGRKYCYKHDLIIHMCREAPPFYEYQKFWEYLQTENLVKHICGKKLEFEK